MSGKDGKIKTALDRLQNAIEQRPSTAAGRMALSLSLSDGLKGKAQSDQWTFLVDEPEGIGGSESAPSPGVYGFAAIASCLAITTKLLAVRSSIEINDIKVEVDGDYDSGLFFGVGDSGPEFTNMRITIVVDSPESDETLNGLVQQARAQSTWYNMFVKSHSIETVLQRV